MAWWLLQQLATVTLLIVVVHVISRIFSLGPVARHALWAVVLIKLITPPLVAWPWAVAAQGPHTAATRPESMAASPTALFTMLVEAVSPDMPADASSSAAAATRQSSRPSWPTLALIGWISGSLVFGLVQLARTIRLARLVRRSTALPIESLDRLAGEVAATIGVRAVKVQVVDGLASPMVWALGRPRLLWPSDLKGLDANAIRALLTHEFAHIKRRDHWVGWLDLAAGIVWWWTPMYWHARRHIRQHAELACDAWAAESLDANRRAYADALLALCASPSTPTLPASALGIHTEDRRFLERRLAVIMRPSTPLRLSRFGLCAVAIATCLTLPAFAQRPAPVVMTPVESGQQTAGGPVMVIPDGAVVMPHAGTRVEPPVVAGIAVAAQSLPAEAQALLNSYSEAAGKAQRETEERLARALDPAVPLSQSNLPAQSDEAELPPFHPEVARPGAGITNPVPIKQPNPVYTPEAMQMRITGTVTLDVLVDETGAVKDARVRKSLDERWLDPEALKATKQWTFRPARNARNEPIPMVVMLEHEFRLRPSAEAR